MAVRVVETVSEIGGLTSASFLLVDPQNIPLVSNPNNPLFFYRIVRAFLVEEAKIVKKVLKSQAVPTKSKK
jgi:hypothetical protein